MPTVDGKEYDDAVWAFAESIFWKDRVGCYIPESYVNTQVKKIYAYLKKEICKRLAQHGLTWESSTFSTEPPSESSRPFITFS